MLKIWKLLYFLCLLIILSSCSHVKKDGPPNFYVDETKIPNAVPKPEPLAKYGNYKSYVVFGKRYRTLPSSHHYEEVGTASWYGSKFHTRKTSSGERYDMLGMTAAHKTLPLPTYVEVTNLKNHRKIIVKVNDRGPFKSNRIIDLSYVAAKKLGMLGRGTTMVKVKAINPYTYGKPGSIFAAKSRLKHKTHFATKTHAISKKHFASKTRFTSHRDKSFYLQVGAFHNKHHALQMQRRLSTAFSYPVKVLSPSKKGSLYRVKIGPFKNTAKVDKVTHQLKQLGIKSSMRLS